MLEDDYICSCMSVSRADIFKAVAQGAKNLDQLVELTGANEGCGTCTNELYACLNEALAACRTRQAHQKARLKGQKFFPFF